MPDLTASSSIFYLFSGLAVEIKETFVCNPSLNDLLPNKIFAQKLPSIVCSHVLNPQPGECILDMCAAPGGSKQDLNVVLWSLNCYHKCLWHGCQKPQFLQIYGRFDDLFRLWHIWCYPSNIINTDYFIVQRSCLTSVYVKYLAALSRLVSTNIRATIPIKASDIYVPNNAFLTFIWHTYSYHRFLNPNWLLLTICVCLLTFNA